MDFFCQMFWNHLPSVMTEKRIVDGIEQDCLVIPTRVNQIKKGRTGNWMSSFRIVECPPNEKLITHEIQLGYLDWDEVNKAREHGYYNRTQHMGRVRIHDRTPSRKIDRINHAQDIVCNGTIILSDIPKSRIFRNAENDMRYVEDLKFRSLTDDTFLYIGSICVDDIPLDDIQTEPYTGKKFVNAVFRRLERLDTYMNTHQLIIDRDDGSEIEIGRFKEFRKEGEPAVTPQEEHTTTVNPRPPESINGIKF